VTLGSRRVRPDPATDAPPVSAGTLDAQAVLLVELLRLVGDDTPSVQQVLELVRQRLFEAVGLERLELLELSPQTDALASVSTGTDEIVVPLRWRGTPMGTLTLGGGELAGLRPEVVELVAHHLAATMRTLADEQDRKFEMHSARAVRRLLEDGAHATSVEMAGEILARVTADAFRTERAAVHLVNSEGRIRHVVGVGVTPEMSDALVRSLVGRMARDSPVWRSTELAARPILVDDANLVAMRAGGFVGTMQLRSYVAMPLLSDAGLVGLALCGDATRVRVWTARDHELAGQLALEGALVVDGARLRNAERLQLADLTRQAFHDALTGLPNRPLLLDRVGRAIELAARGDERVGVLLVDLDGFKQVNDTLGHHAGDLVLQAVARRLMSAVRDRDLVARLGGDEFAILLAGNPTPETVSAVAARIHSGLAAPFDIEDRQVAIGASVGMALFPDHAVEVGALIRVADEAMYKSKRRGAGDSDGDSHWPALVRNAGPLPA
jgi:diguanylate cyclase (GGDEF)-like protein